MTQTMKLVQTKTHDYVLHLSADGQKTVCGLDVSNVIMEQFPIDKPELIQMIHGLPPHAWLCGNCQKRAAKENDTHAQ